MVGTLLTVGLVHSHAKGNAMLLYLTNLMDKLNQTPLEFFETAHLWAFGKASNIIPDVYNFVEHGTIPRYVEKYVRHIEEK